MSSDRVLEEMAGELRHSLLAAGLDPKRPPPGPPPMVHAAFAEYRRRGGEDYRNADAFVSALVAEVGK